MQKTIYVPDELADELQHYPNINVSAVCQAALRRELIMLETLNETERVEVELDERTVAFQGNEVAYSEVQDTTFYVTAKGAVAVYSGERLTLDVQPDFASFAEAYEDWASEVSQVAEAMGEQYVEVLDI